MTEKKPASEQLAWIDRLPEKGGVWGLGITETVKSIEEEKERLEAQLDSLKSQIKAREKLLKDKVKQASKEAPLLYSEDAVERAKVERVSKDTSATEE